MIFVKRFIQLMSFCLVVAVGAAIAWFGWQWYRTDIFSQIKDTQAALQTQQVQLEKIEAVLQQHNAQFQQVAKHSEQVVSSIQQLNNEIHQGDAVWQTAQIQFYLQRAAQETFLMRNPNAALGWLEAALLDVMQAHQPQWLVLQTALEKDINSLRQAGGDQASQAMISLINISSTIATLPHQQLPTFTQEEVQEQPQTADKGWKKYLSYFWNSLRGLVRIRAVETEIVPYLNQDEKLLINENVQLMLEQASLSAMRANQALYQSHIAQAMTWIARYYDQQDKHVQQVLTELKALNAVTVAFTPPKQLDSLTAWAQLNSASGSKP